MGKCDSQKDNKNAHISPILVREHTITVKMLLFLH